MGHRRLQNKELGHNHHISGLQHNVLLSVPAPDDIVVIKRIPDLLFTYVAEDINVFAFCKVPQAPDFCNQLQNRHGTVDGIGSLMRDLTDEVHVAAVNLAHTDRDLRDVHEWLELLDQDRKSVV